MARKYRGHYCYVCGRVRPNEKFTGRGHGKHICKDCSRKKKPSAPGEQAPFVQPEPDVRHDPPPLRDRALEDLLLMLFYLSATGNAELDQPRCDRSALDRLIAQLERAELITSHKCCFMLTEAGTEEAANLLTEFGLDRWDNL